MVLLTNSRNFKYNISFTILLLFFYFFKVIAVLDNKYFCIIPSLKNICADVASLYLKVLQIKLFYRYQNSDISHPDCYINAFLINL